MGNFIDHVTTLYDHIKYMNDYCRFCNRFVRILNLNGCEIAKYNNVQIKELYLNICKFTEANKSNEFDKFVELFITDRIYVNVYPFIFCNNYETYVDNKLTIVFLSCVRSSNDIGLCVHRYILQKHIQPKTVYETDRYYNNCKSRELIKYKSNEDILFKFITDGKHINDYKYPEIYKFDKRNFDIEFIFYL